MKELIIHWSVILACAWFSPVATVSLAQGVRTENTVAHGSAERPVTVADAIRMTHLADPLQGRAIAHYSPDGQKFVVILRKGNLEKNTNDFSILLWSTADVFSSPIPEVLLTLSSSSNRDAIEDVSWLDDNETVVFLGEQPGQLHQLYAFNVQTHTLQALTNQPTNLTSYTISPNGDEIAYTAEAPSKSVFDEKSERHGVVISTQTLGDLLVGKRIEAGYGEDQQLFFQAGKGPSRLMKVTGQIPAPGQGVAFLSPNGKYIVILLQVPEIPENWKEYSDPQIHDITRRELRRGQFSWLAKYVLIDTATGESRTLLNSPVKTWDTDVAWSPESRSVVLMNVHLPLDNAYGEDRKARQSQSFALEVKIPSGELVKVSNENLKLLRWDSKTNRLIFASGRYTWKRKAGQEISFRKIGENWEQVTDAASGRGRPEIVQEEDMNTPPKIVAVDSGAQRRALLLDLNLEFKELKFTKVEEIKWHGTDGHEVKGGLYYPLNYVPGKRYPLVIQTHMWTSELFWIDGPFSTAYAAQPLAGKGILVLQAENFEDKDKDWWYKEINTPEEIDRYVSAYEGAIDYLDQRKLINRSRIGIIGFSRTCLYVKYALTHSRYHFAAASVTDGNDAGYFQYIALNAKPNAPREIEGFNGGPPFGQGLKLWMERSPAFNVDKVRTPLLITAENPGVLLYEWEWFAALTRLRKPVELIMMQDGDHILQKPWERMISLQSNLDWFCFWLKGEEDPDPSKAEQYARWRELRKLQEKQVH